MSRAPAIEVASPSTLEAALLLLSDGRPWRVLAGGTKALGDLRSRATHVLSLGSLGPELRFVAVSPKGFRAGALVTLRDLAHSQGVREKFPLLAAAARCHATPAMQRRSTLAGTLVDGRGALAAALYALGAMVDARSSKGARRGEAAATKPSEIELVTHVAMAVPEARARQLFAKTPEAVVVAGLVVVPRRGAISSRLFAASPTHRPLRMTRTEAALAASRGGSWANAITKDLEPLVPARRALAATAAVSQHLSEALANAR